MSCKLDFSDHFYKWNHNVWLFESDLCYIIIVLLRWPCCCNGLSMLYSLSQYTIFCLIQLLMNIWVVFIFWLWWVMLQYLCMFLCGQSLGIGIKAFEDPLNDFPKWLCFPTNHIWTSPLLHTYYCLCFYFLITNSSNDLLVNTNGNSLLTFCFYRESKPWELSSGKWTSLSTLIVVLLIWKKKKTSFYLSLVVK